ncbi:hypothetical protein [Streptococcus pyogenes]|uniref:hypothetical protein n=1 Tax=Streptococcus pyogenes TaxID=1314 RepID=UPI0002D635A3|nr:hypothetical protein HMPREF1231_0488 [Streptococcus pyogenes GA06023]ESA46678.1 hypothetical protein HMPREF1232_0178 [Streptococcus pyogenes GA40468]NSX75545.1 hypothetical protein [Streptococcus pyogenes]NSX79003.1 hypothetical protein [Streptococcus pyogenes]NTS61690.1 hypothetical protein [Streptococcus pyogenes]
MVGKSEELEIFFFYKMIPEAIIDKLNAFLNISFADSLPLDKPIKNPLDFHRKELILPTPPDKLHAPLYNLDSLTAATQKQIHH